MKKFESLESRQMMTIDALVDPMNESLAQLMSNDSEPYDQALISEGDFNIPGFGNVRTCLTTFQVRCPNYYNDEAIFSELDFSGVHHGTKSGTLVSHDILISAAHYGSLPNRLEFYDPNGIQYVRSPQSSQVVHIADNFQGGTVTDVLVTRLNEPLPNNIATYKLPDADFVIFDLQRAPMIYLDQHNDLYIGRANDVAAGYNYIQILPNFNYPFQYKTVVGGDSGHPSFFLWNNEPILAMTFHYSTVQGPYLGDPAIQQGVIDAAESLGSPYQIEAVEWGSRANPQAVDEVFSENSRRRRTHSVPVDNIVEHVEEHSSRRRRTRR